MSTQESKECEIDSAAFAAMVDDVTKPYDPNIVPLKPTIVCKTSNQPPMFDITKSKLFKQRETRLKVATVP